MKRIISQVPYNAYICNDIYLFICKDFGPAPLEHFNVSMVDVWTLEEHVMAMMNVVMAPMKLIVVGYKSRAE